MRLIVEKEREIEAFVPQEYWKIKAEFEKDEIEFTGELAKYNNKKLEIKNGEEASAIYESLNKEFEIAKIFFCNNFDNLNPMIRSRTLLVSCDLTRF